jgi:diguanylate cyclase (GGDEF)-like protein
VLIRDRHGHPDYLLIQVEDLSGEHEAKERLRYERYHDELTGLHNLAWIQDSLDAELQACPSDRQVGVLFIDLDDFKVVNDSLGHGAGDRVLATVAQRIAAQLPDSAHLGRFGGDEFVVIVPDVSAPKQLERIAERILAAVSRHIGVLDHTLVPSACIGIGLSAPHSTPADLLRDTDSALFRAKAAGRGHWHFFDDDTHSTAVQRLTIESELRQSLGRGHFVVYYQPIVHLLEQRIVGYEALVRWQHPVRGLLTPADFLPVAEECGLIVDISQEVLTLVCRTLADYPQIPSISINLSAVQLLRSGWSSAFLRQVREAGVQPQRLTVEITETSALEISHRTRAGLRTLRRAGVNIHVDDFGTGFSSIALLRELPVTGLKLDASFVRNLTGRKSAANALAAGLAGLADGLGLTGVAEGIEGPLQVERLVALGWRYGQGYHFSPPQPIAALSEDLARSTP